MLSKIEDHDFCKNLVVKSNYFYKNISSLNTDTFLMLYLFNFKYRFNILRNNGGCSILIRNSGTFGSEMTTETITTHFIFHICYGVGLLSNMIRWRHYSTGNNSCLNRHPIISKVNFIPWIYCLESRPCRIGCCIPVFCIRKNRQFTDTCILNCIHPLTFLPPTLLMWDKFVGAVPNLMFD